MRSKRGVFAALLVLMTVGGAVPALADSPKQERRERRHERREERREVRRIIRRRVIWREIEGRRRLVVPLAVAVGWNLDYDGRVVVVKEVRPELVVVTNPDGTEATIDVVKEDTAENGKDQ
jgi:hypothetical protein